MWNFFKRNFFTIILIALVLVFYFYQSNINSAKIAEMKEREKILQEQVNAMELEIQKLQDYYEFSQTPEFIERLAREKLKMVKPNEIIYFIEELKKDNEKE